MGLEFPYRLYLVISQGDCAGRNLVDVAEQAVAGGVDIVQLREKDVPTEVFVERALRLKEVLAKDNVPLIVNDDLEVARAVDAFGIHVGNKDIPPTEIRASWEGPHCLGYSIEYLEQLHTDETRASDYLGVSPVFSTATKTDTVTEWGLKGIEQIRSLTDKPLVAIGSINANNAFEVVKAGSDCLAVVSAICKAHDPAKAAWALRNEIEKAL